MKMIKGGVDKKPVDVDKKISITDLTNNESVIARYNQIVQNIGRNPGLQVKGICCQRSGCAVCSGVDYVHGPYIYANYVDKKKRSFVYLGPVNPKR